MSDYFDRLQKFLADRQQPLDVESLRRGPDLIGELLRAMSETAADPVQLAALADSLQSLAAKVGSELQGAAGGEAIDFRDIEQLREWVRDAERILVERLVESVT